MTTSEIATGRPAADPDAVAVAQAVYDATGPLQAILFGSRARGTHRPDSDIDIAIITAEPVAEEAREAYDRIAEQAAAGHPEAPATHVAFLTVAKFLEERVRKNTVANNIAREGRPVMREEAAGYSPGFEEGAVNWSDVDARAKDAQGLATDLEIMTSSGRATEKMVGYIAQQCLEHAYKALIASRGGRYPTGGRDGHNLRILAGRAQEVMGGAFQVPGREWQALAAYAGSGRYAQEQPALGDRRQLYREISAAVAAILNRIPPNRIPPNRIPQHDGA